MIDIRVVTVDRYNPTALNFATTIWNNLPNIRYKFVLSDKGDASWQVPMSYPGLARDAFSPISHDYRIGVNNNGDGWNTAHEGIIGPVGLKSDEQLINVQGYDYLWWLEQPFHFLGYELDPSSWAASDLVYEWTNKSQQFVITDILSKMFTSTLTSVHIVPNFVGDKWGQVIADFEMLGSTTSVLDKIKSIGELNEPYGFDFWMDVADSVTGTKPMYLSAPAMITQAEAQAEAIGYFTPSSNNGLLTIDWTNNGPRAITTVGIPPAGFGLKGFSTDLLSPYTYRDWYEIHQFNNAFKMISQSLVDSATDAIGTLWRNPQKQLTISFYAEVAGGTGLEDFWFYTHVGEYIWVDSEDWFMPYHRVQAAFKILSQEITGDNAGNWICNLTLQQVYTT